MREIKKENHLAVLVGNDLEGPYLIGGQCGTCREKFFPMQSICPRCTARNIMEVKLSRKGKLYTYTEVYQKPPDYAGPAPYFLGRVLLPEGVFILTQLKVDNKAELRMNGEMELAVEPLYYDEEGKEVKGYKFKPV